MAQAADVGYSKISSGGGRNVGGGATIQKSENPSPDELDSAVQIGAAEAITLELVAGAGGEASLPGDYLYGNHREPYREAGLWGIFRVHPADSDNASILALP